MDKIDQIKVYLPKEMKDKFIAKVKKEDRTQTSALKSMITEYLKK